MSALSEARNTREILAGGIHYTRKMTVTSGGTVYAGGMVALGSSGCATAATSRGGLVLGRAENTAVNGGDVYVTTGMFVYNPVSSGAITKSNINKKCTVVDDQTVTISGGTADTVAGIVRDVLNDGGVVVELGTIVL